MGNLILGLLRSYHRSYHTTTGQWKTQNTGFSQLPFFQPAAIESQQPLDPSPDFQNTEEHAGIRGVQRFTGWLMCIKIGRVLQEQSLELRLLQSHHKKWES